MKKQEQLGSPEDNTGESLDPEWEKIRNLPVNVPQESGGKAESRGDDKIYTELQNEWLVSPEHQKLQAQYMENQQKVTDKYEKSKKNQLDLHIVHTDGESLETEFVSANNEGMRKTAIQHGPEMVKVLYNKKIDDIKKLVDSSGLYFKLEGGGMRAVTYEDVVDSKSDYAGYFLYDNKGKDVGSDKKHEFLDGFRQKIKEVEDQYTQDKDEAQNMALNKN